MPQQHVPNPLHAQLKFTHPAPQCMAPCVPTCVYKSVVLGEYPPATLSIGDFVICEKSQVFYVVFFAADAASGGDSSTDSLVVLARVPSPYAKSSDGALVLHRQTVVGALTHFSLDRTEQEQAQLCDQELVDAGIVRSAVTTSVRVLVDGLNLGQWLPDAVDSKVVNDVAELQVSRRHEECSPDVPLRAGGDVRCDTLWHTAQSISSPATPPPPPCHSV